MFEVLKSKIEAIESKRQHKKLAKFVSSALEPNMYTSIDMVTAYQEMLDKLYGYDNDRVHELKAKGYRDRYSIQYLVTHYGYHDQHSEKEFAYHVVMGLGLFMARYNLGVIDLSSCAKMAVHTLYSYERIADPSQTPWDMITTSYPVYTLNDGRRDLTDFEIRLLKEDGYRE